MLSVLHLSFLCRRDGVVCVAIRLRVGKSTSRASFPSRCKRVLFPSQLPERLGGAHPTYCSKEPWNFSPGIRWPEHEADH